MVVNRFSNNTFYNFYICFFGHWKLCKIRYMYCLTVISAGKHVDLQRCIVFIFQAEERANEAEAKVVELEKEIDACEGKTDNHSVWYTACFHLLIMLHLISPD